MTARKLNFKQISIAYGFCTVASLPAGYVIGWTLEKWGYRPDYPYIAALTWFFVAGLPSLVVGSTKLLHLLGKQEPTTVTASGGTYRGRSIPFTRNGEVAGNVFLSSLPWIGGKAEAAAADYESELPESWDVRYMGEIFVFTVSDVREFLSIAVRRQRAHSKKSGLSERYWVREHRPPMELMRYKAMIDFLIREGLLVERGERRSGRLIMPVDSSIRHLQGIRF